MTLPTAATTRWQPLRTGLVDLFYYDYQEFWFRDGRVLFRGNNGTGKSKVLALTLPFLLDGDLTPSRVEPDGDRAKKMEWNLLLGGKYEERLGYSWLEFGRITEDGERAYVTIGVGLKAVAGRGIADRWFFLTSQRVGEDLFLIGPNGTALTRDRLTEAIGQYGQVTQRAEAYRRMLDEHLFHLGPERYDSLINLLIQLRQPQLSKRPDENRLSQALSDALAPVDQAVLADIATAFHDLQQQREELDGLRDTRAHVARFLDRYRRYASVAARRQTRELRSTHAAYEGVQRNLADVRQVIGDAEAEERAARAELEDSRTEQAEQTAIRDELSSDPRLKNFADAQRYAEAAQDAAGKARQAARRATAKREERLARRGEAARAAERSREAVALGPARAYADQAGLTDGHTALLEPLRLPDGPPPGEQLHDHGSEGGLRPGTPGRDHAVVRSQDHGGGNGSPADGSLPYGPLPDRSLRSAERAAKDLAGARLEAVAHLTRLAERAAKEQAELLQARRVLTEREADRDTVRDLLGEAHDAVAAAGEHHAGEWRAFRRTLTVLDLPDPDETGLAAWVETLDGPDPMREALRAAAADAQQSLAAARAQARHALDQAREELRERTEERDLLASGVAERPRAPHTRGEGTRQGPGAALWQVVDFAPGLGAAERAGLEAALEASGLLDAWLTPDGRLVDGHDTVAVAGTPVARNLAGALVPIVDQEDPQAAALTAQTVRLILESVGLGEQDGAVWVDTDGRWRLGPLNGAWAKDAAAYVGHTAREEARRRRLAELAAQIEAAAAAVERAEEAVGRIEQRQATLAGELRREPDDQPLRDAHSAVGSARRELERLQARVDDQANRVEWAQRDVDQAVRERDDAAADLRLPADLAGLADVREAIGGYRHAVNELLSAARAHADRLRDLATWEAELAAALSEEAEADADARDAEVRAAEERSRLETLQDAIGASVEELQDRLAAARTRLTELAREIERLDAAHRGAERKRAKAEGLEEGLRTQLAEAQGRRDAAIEDLRRFTATGLMEVACQVEIPEAPWAAAPAVQLARRAEEQLKDVDDGDESWRRIQDEITRRFAELSEALTRHGHHAMAGLDDWFVVAIQFQGRERPPAELTGLLDAEIGYRERMLTAKERDLLEEHLVNDVASHLQELISEAEAQVGHMNAELEDRPTSTGMRLRMRWEPHPDGPAGLAEARRRLLRQNSDLWSPDDRAAVGDFLQRQIEAVRLDDEHGTWQEHLRKALDYRGWHRFVIERFQDGRWRSAVGPASGGERVLTVSLPLFAAASSHYRSAHPHAPRLVTLDEAFAGVDDDSRAKCLGLLATFDLDVVMTSEREWGFYATVPGIAAHQLVRRDGIDAVHVTTWEWDGRTSEQVDREFIAREPAPAVAPAPSPPAEEDPLF
ncbi:TIGR02680 family protein [Actinomadura alba]|uniref:TIGR02680 family protein n=1 Tax=Actinomadura alba TaxID=406431 RepID=A0ABR7LPM1_9ACTN|nr:TIGR02680 family protein [Actinomadura alba]MBC6466734.1 TIGR02680 family protein [Actinomadura alba]